MDTERMLNGSSLGTPYNILALLTLRGAYNESFYQLLFKFSAKIILFFRITKFSALKKFIFLKILAYLQKKQYLCTQFNSNNLNTNEK